MGFFSTTPKTNPLEEKLLTQLEELSAQVAELRGESRAIREVTGLTNEVNKLKNEITDLEISKSKITEENERERREIEHKVGLEKTRQGQELELGLRQAKLEVQEENLQAEKTRFDENVKFIKDETADTRKLVTELLDAVKNMAGVKAPNGGDE